MGFGFSGADQGPGSETDYLFAPNGGGPAGDAGQQSSIDPSRFAGNPNWSSVDPRTGKINQSGSGGMDFSWMSQGQQANADAQRQALKNSQDLYNGKGPSLATQLLQQNANRAMANENAMASSAGGSQSALARRQAMMANADTMQQLGGQAATARAQEQLGALDMQGRLAGQGRAQDLALAGMQGSAQEQQANDYLQSYAIKQGVNLAQNQQNLQEAGMVASGVGTALMAAGDLHLKEPGPGGQQNMQDTSGAHWIIREEPDFLLAANMRTGQMRKILTAPLSPDEHSQAMSRHGAGPLGSPNPANKYANDLDMSNPQGDSFNQVPPSDQSYPYTDPAPMPSGAPPISQPGQPNTEQLAPMPQSMRGNAPNTDQLAANPFGAGPPKNTTGSGGTSFFRTLGAGLMGAGGAKGEDIRAMLNKGKKPGQPGQPGQPGLNDQAAKGNVAGDVDLKSPDYVQQFRQQYADARQGISAPRGVAPKAQPGSPDMAGDVDLGGQPPQQASIQTGADQLIAAMARDRGGYGFQGPATQGFTSALPTEVTRPILADNARRDEAQAARDRDRAARDLPKEKYEKVPASFSNEGEDYDPKSSVGSDYESDLGIFDPRKGPRNLDRGGLMMDTGGIVPDSKGNRTIELPEETIKASPPKPAGNAYQPTAADLHLGGKMASGTPRTGGALRGLTAFYGGGMKLDKPGKSLVMEAFSGKPRGKKAA